MRKRRRKGTKNEEQYFKDNADCFLLYFGIDGM